MPTPYRGKIRISCGLSTCAADRARQDVQADCLGCPDAIREILDLSDNVLFGNPGMSEGAETDVKTPPAEGRKRSKKQGGN